MGTDDGGGTRGWKGTRKDNAAEASRAGKNDWHDHLMCRKLKFFFFPPYPIQPCVVVIVSPLLSGVTMRYGGQVGGWMIDAAGAYSTDTCTRHYDARG